MTSSPVPRKMGPEATKSIGDSNSSPLVTLDQASLVFPDSPGAPKNVYTVSNWLSGLADQQVPMTSPNVAKKSSAKQTSERKEQDLGQKLAGRRSQDFTSKIVGWNDAGTVQAQDEVVVVDGRDVSDTAKEESDVIVDVESDNEESEHEAEEQPGDETPNTPKTPISSIKGAQTPGSRKTSRQMNAERKAWVRRRPKPQEKNSPEVKEVAAPKKRVVSDGHWRRDRIPAKKETATPEKPEEERDILTMKDKDLTPKPVVIRRSVVSVGLKVPPSVQDFVEHEAEPVKIRPLPGRARSPPLDGESREVTPDYESSGMKVYIKRKDRSNNTEAHKKNQKGFSTSESNFTATSVDGPSTATDITTPERSPIDEKGSSRPNTEPRNLPSRRPLNDKAMPLRTGRSSLEAEDALRRTSRRKSKTPEKTSDQPKIPSGKSAPREKEPPRPIPRVFGNRIEGWLANMPEDPFAESSDASLPPDPVDIAGRKSGRTVREQVKDIENVNESRRRNGRIGSSRRSLEPIDSNERLPSSKMSRAAGDPGSDSSQAQTPTLKRSGARRSTYTPPRSRQARTESPEYLMSGALPSLPRTDAKRYVSNNAQDRALPSPSNRLATIASVETFQPPSLTPRPRAPSDGSEAIVEGSVLSRASDGDDPRSHGCGLKRRLTKHSDLISILSLPKEDDHPIVSARSIRTRRARHGSATAGDIMNEVTTDELKYQRELRTLVDGVIPVLLNYVLKSDTQRIPGSRQSSAQNKPALTQPIVEMGVALERLKAIHKRIPMHSPEELLSWADGASRVYEEYLKAWRLGFHDVVVNLAPADDSARKASWDQGFERNDDGDLLKGDGERVDVAYLLKRPLVRLKYLAKTFKSIDLLHPSVKAGEKMAQYQELVLQARRRANDERSRLEDEAAASIDPTRARDLQSLAPLTGVSIDPTRSVRARDYFDMELYHSSGQQLGCTIEILMRDDAPDRGSLGDLLFCEVGTPGKWLLFPPVLANHVSARKGDKDGEIVVMIRGQLAGGKEWREILSLHSSTDQVAEWVQMLGSNPMPPKLTKQSSFNTRRRPSGINTDAATSEQTEDLDLPIGERAMATARKWDGSEVNSVLEEEPPPSLNLHRAKALRYRDPPPLSIPADTAVSNSAHRYDAEHSPHDRNDSRRRYNGGESYQRQTSYSGRSRADSDYLSGDSASTTKREYNVWLPSSDHGFSDESSADDDDRPEPRRPSMRRRTSSVPSTEMPTIPKLRKDMPLRTPVREPDHHRSESSPTVANTAISRSAPGKLHKLFSSSKDENKENRGSPDKTPQPQSHVKSSAQGLKSGGFPSFTPAFLKRHRRSSSPLKHEYEPSSSSDLSESDLSGSDSEESITSESSADDIQDAISTLGELRDFNKFGSSRPFHQPVSRPGSLAADADTVSPSESASQAPFRRTPSMATGGSAKTVASIFCWSDSGSWATLHPQECEIVVTPGLIEAFDVAQAHQVAPNSGDAAEPSPSQRGVKPLVALELTPLVPLRRGTALDISIRSPPTSNSLLRTGNNIMFRSRSPEECEKLYGFINRARIDNPTWIALQNARGPVPTSNWAEVMDRRNASRSNSGSWFKTLSRKGSTYRSTGTRALSTVATESSVGTVNTAFSALRRFSGGSRIFNIAKSTISSRHGTRSSYSDSLESGAATPITIDASMGTPVGITNAKIRLYLRENASKWRDLGSARLTVMLPPRSDATAPVDPGMQNREKRILVSGNSRGETMLDVILPESSFERIARTGIAVSVWEDALHIAATGGVASSKKTVYMLQMKSERDAAYTFSMVGKLRY